VAEEAEKSLLRAVKRRGNNNQVRCGVVR
jgi:hypothetical protein